MTKRTKQLSPERRREVQAASAKASKDFAARPPVTVTPKKSSGRVAAKESDAFRLSKSPSRYRGR